MSRLKQQPEENEPKLGAGDYFVVSTKCGDWRVSTEMVRFIAWRALVKQPDGARDSVFGPVVDDRFLNDVEQLTSDVVGWIDSNLGRGYAWPARGLRVLRFQPGITPRIS